MHLTALLYSGTQVVNPTITGSSESGHINGVTVLTRLVSCVLAGPHQLELVVLIFNLLYQIKYACIYVCMFDIAFLQGKKKVTVLTGWPLAGVPLY